MKLIAATLRNDALDELVSALTHTRATGLTATEVRVLGGSNERMTYRGSDMPVATVRTRVEIVVEDEGVEAVLRALVALGSNAPGDEGVAFVLPVTDAYRIRTGDWEGNIPG